MRIDSTTNFMTSSSGRSAVFSQKPPSLEDILNRDKKVRSVDEQINEQKSRLADKLSDRLANGLSSELVSELTRDQILKQFQSGKLNTPVSQDTESEKFAKSEKSVDSIESNKSSESESNNKSSSAFRMGGTESILQEQRTNAPVNNIVALRIQQNQASGASNSGVTAGSSVSHGTNMSEQMQARKAANQAQSSLVSQQMARQVGLIDAARAETSLLEAGGMSGPSAQYLAGLRSDARTHALKEQGISEEAERRFEAEKEEREEEIKANTVNGEYIEEGIGETGSSGEAAVITGSDGSGASGDSDVDIPTGSGGSGNSGADDAITVNPDNVDEIIIGGSSSSAGALITTGTTGQGSSEPTLTTTGKTTGTGTTNNSSSDTSSTASFKGIEFAFVIR